MYYFFENRISILFMYLFLYFFVIKRFNRKTTIIMMVVSYLVTVLIEVASSQYEPSSINSIITRILTILMVQGTCFYISENRGFSCLFIGLSATVYVWLGNIAFEYLYVEGQLGFGIFCQLILHSFLLIMLVRWGKDVYAYEVDTPNVKWASLCIAPITLYILMMSLTIWPFNFKNQPLIIIPGILIMVVTFLVYLSFMHTVQSNLTADDLRKYDERFSAFSRQMQSEIKAYEEFDTKMAIARHDARHRYHLILSYLDEGAYEKIRELINTTSEMLNETKPEKFCANLSMNGIMRHYRMLANSMEVSLKYDIHLGNNFSDERYEFEFISAFSNILENAIKAAGNITNPDNRWVTISVTQEKNHVGVRIENSYEESKTELLPSKKKLAKGHGYGLQSIKAFANKYNAVYSMNLEGGVAVSRLVINI